MRNRQATELLFEQSRPGRRAVRLPECDVPEKPLMPLGPLIPLGPEIPEKPLEPERPMVPENPDNPLVPEKPLAPLVAAAVKETLVKSSEMASVTLAPTTSFPPTLETVVV